MRLSLSNSQGCDSAPKDRQSRCQEGIKFCGKMKVPCLPAFTSEPAIDISDVRLSAESCCVAGDYATLHPSHSCWVLLPWFLEEWWQNSWDNAAEKGSCGNTIASIWWPGVLNGWRKKMEERKWEIGMVLRPARLISGVFSIGWGLGGIIEAFGTN